jgi:hypothetical protein
LQLIKDEEKDGRANTDGSKVIVFKEDEEEK